MLPLLTDEIAVAPTPVSLTNNFYQLVTLISHPDGEPAKKGAKIRFKHFLFLVSHGTSGHVQVPFGTVLLDFISLHVQRKFPPSKSTAH